MPLFTNTLTGQKYEYVLPSVSAEPRRMLIAANSTEVPDETKSPHEIADRTKGR